MSMSFAADVRQAVRGLLRVPVITVAAVLCLGLGIGSTAAIYSAVRTALLSPLPFPRPNELVTVYRTTPQFDTGPFAPANYLDLRRDARSLEGIAAVSQSVALLQGGEESVRVTAWAASDNLFDLLGARPLAGRLLRAGDEATDQPLVAVLTEELWRDRFGAAGDMVGRTIRLDGEQHEVVGILPAGFRFPHGGRAMSSDVWVPLRFTPEVAARRRSNYLLAMGRLKPGATVASADAELKRIMDGIVEIAPELRGEQVRVLPMHAESVRAVRGPLVLLLGAVAFVLLIAAANVASLLLARGVGRRQEFAVRTVLGAGTANVIRPALVESMLIAFAGAVLGLGLAWTGVRAIGTVAAVRLPQLTGLALDWNVAAVALAVAAVVAIVCGAAPAWQAAGSDPQEALRSGGRNETGGSQHRLLRALVAAEVGLSLVLLLGAGLVLRGFERLTHNDPGFDPSGILTMNVNVPPLNYAEARTVEGFMEPALEAIRAIPGVVDAGAITLIPYVNWGSNFNVRYEGQPGDEPTRQPLVESRTASPGYFGALGMKLVAGRLLTRQDAAENAPAVVVANEALVARDFPGQDVIGKRFHIRDTTFATIVGVVKDIRNFGPDRPPQPEVYWSWGEGPNGGTTFPLVVRVQGDPSSYARTVTAAIQSVDPTVAVSSVRPMTEAIAVSVGRPKFYLTLLAIFACVALVLAVAGLYGVMSYAVARRTRELGIRSALGSTPQRTVALVLRQGMTLVAFGVVAGLAAGAGLTRLLGSLLYGISPVDALTWSVVTLLLAGAGAIAILIPATRASAVDPLVAMRTD